MYIYMCPSLSISVHNDIEMKGEPDTVSLPIPNCVAKDIFSSPIKEDDERNIFGIAPAAITDSAAAAAVVAAPDAPASQNPDSIGESDDVDIEDDSDENGTSAGGGEGIDENVASGESNNNESSFTNNNNNNNNNNNLMKRKLKDIIDEQADDEYDLARPPPKRVSPFLNTPKQRKDERKQILRLSVYKLREMEDPESFLRKSVLVNNVLRRLHKEIREEKRGYAGFGLGSATMAMSHPYYRPRRFDYDMLNNSHLPTRTAFFFDEPCFPGETEKITDDMTDSLVRSLEASSPPLSPVPTPPPSPSPTSNLLMSTPTQSPLTLSPLLSPSSSSSTLQLPGSPYPGIPSASTPASTSLSSPLTITTAADGAVLATTATAIPTIITTTRLPSQLSSTSSSTTASTRIPSTSEEMLLANDHSSRNAISIFTNSSSCSGSSTVLANTRALSSRITQNGITISRCTSSLTSNCSSNLSFANKSTDTSRTIKSGSPNNGVTDGSGCSTTSDNNNNNDTVCNANGSQVFGTSGTTDHASVPLATSRTPGLHNNSNSDIPSTNNPVVFSTTNFGTGGFVSVSGLTPNSSFSCFVSSTTTTTTTTTSPTMNTSSANSMSPSIAFPEKQLPVEMDTMFNNLISVLGET